MPLESMRRRLIAQTRDWGAPPPVLGHVPATTPSKLGTSMSATEPSFDATTAVNMDYVVTEPPHSKIISSKDWTVDALVKRGPRFQRVPRVSATAPVSRLCSAIEDHERTGIPLIIEGWHKHRKWDKKLFTVDWFREHGRQDVKARNVHDWSDKNVLISELIDKQRAISTSITPDETERLYGKDAHCPEAWADWLNNSGVIPGCLLPEGSNNLLQSLPEAERVETLMCYLGVGDTFTPCHKDLCASSGQNVMCYTENSGSSFWFMTESSSAPAVADYFHELGHELDLEAHVITVKELEKAPFKVYIEEQKLGDMVLVPPRSCHQVVNHGGITIKMSWSRMTLEGLTAAFYHELPIYRRVCRTETYRVKYTIYHTMLRRTQELQKYRLPPPPSSTYDSRLPMSSSRDEPLPLSGFKLDNKLRLANEIERLINLFDDVLVEEFCKEHEQMPHMTASSVSVAYPDGLSGEGVSRVTCDFCDTDVFQSFFECQKCVRSTSPDAMDTATTHEARGGLVICASCYVEGRTCQCEVMQPMQCRPFSELLRDRNRAMEVLQQSAVGKGQTRANTTLSEGDIISAPRLSLFEAACAVHHYYRNQPRNSLPESRKMTRVCARGRETHPVSRNSQLPCKGCHFSLCFDHILQLGVHSAEAMLIYQSDPSNILWHERHKDRMLFTAARPQIVQAEKDGVRCDVRHKMVVVANNFNTCMPSDSPFTKPGWYDKFVQTSNIPTEDCERHAIEDTIDDTVDFEAPDSPLSDLSSLPASPTPTYSPLPDVDKETAPNSDPVEPPPLSLGNEHLSVRPTGTLPNMAYSIPSTANTQPGTSGADTLLAKPPPVEKKRKRQVLDYILMPPLPKAVPPSISSNKKLSAPSTPRAKGKAKQMERNRSPLPVEVEMPQESHNRTDASPLSDRPMKSLPKSMSSKALSKRVVVSSRDSTPDVVAATVLVSPRTLAEDGPPKKKARFRQGLGGLCAKNTAVPAPVSRKHKAGTIPTTVSDTHRSNPSSISESNTSANAMGTVMRRADHVHSHGHPSRLSVTKDATAGEDLAHNVGHSFSDKPLRTSGAAGPSSPALPSTNIAQTPSQARAIRQMEKKLDALEKRSDDQINQINILMKKNKALERKVHKLEGQASGFQDQLLRNSSRQEEYNASQKSRTLREFSAFRDDIEQQTSRIQKQYSDVRSDVGEIRARMAEQAQIGVGPSTSTHIVVQADAISRLLEHSTSMHNNGGQQFGHKQRRHPYNHVNNHSIRQFHQQPDNFEGQHLQPDPPRFNREDGGRGNNYGWGYGWMAPPQSYPHNNGNNYSVGGPGRPPADHAFRPNQHQRGPMGGPSKQPYGGPQQPGKKRYWGPHRSRPVSGTDAQPIQPSQNGEEDVERTHAVRSIKAPEPSSKPSTTGPNQDQVRSPSPGGYWEDDYEMRDEEPTPAFREHISRDKQVGFRSTNEPSTPDSTPREGNVPVGAGPVEQNPWAE